MSVKENQKMTTIAPARSVKGIPKIHDMPKLWVFECAGSVKSAEH